MRIRAVVGIVLLVLVSLFSTLKLTRPTEQFAARFAGITEIVPDNVTLSERRVLPLRASLPPHGTIGYVTDDADGYAAHERYLMVRYALAPVLVENNSAHALVVGNITRPTTDLQSLTRQHNLTLLKDFGGGVLLLEGPSR